MSTGRHCVRVCSAPDKFSLEEDVYVADLREDLGPKIFSTTIRVFLDKVQVVRSPLAVKLNEFQESWLQKLCCIQQKMALEGGSRIKILAKNPHPLRRIRLLILGLGLRLI